MRRCGTDRLEEKVKRTRNLLVIALLLLLSALPFILHFMHVFPPRRLDADKLAPISLTEDGGMMLVPATERPKE